MWTLTYSINGQRRVEYLPDDLAAELFSVAEQGRLYREAVDELMTLNAQLVNLWRKQQRPRRRRGGGTNRRSGT